MANPSNIYAEKIYSEHPNILFALDEQADFISYFSDINLNTFNWTTTNTTSVTQFDNTQSPYGPISTAYSTKITANSGTTTFTIASPAGIPKNIPISIGFYFYSYNTAISSVKIDLRNSSNTSLVSNTISMSSFASAYSAWNYLSTYFDANANADNILITVTYATAASYDFIINGFSIGYQTEEFNNTSIGLQASTIPSTISTTLTQGIVVNNYGVQKQSGYYIVDSNKLLAKNTSVPMVYGSGNCTVIYPHSTAGQPSLILPGFGFMNEINKYTDLTFECWIKINSSATTEKRIIGPINSKDGLYVKGPFLMLKIGSLVDYHYVGEWFRPMLLQISISKTNTAVFINGRQVMNISYSAGTLSFLSKYDGSSKDQDYLGFYAYSDIPSIALDCVAIYPYLVNETISLRRYIYGQGVQYPKQLDSSFNGQSVYVDYPFAGYTNNYNYPDIAKWQGGLSNNITTLDNYIEPIQATSAILPSFNLGSNLSYTQSTLLSDNYTLNSSSPDVTNGTYLTLVPNTNWTNTNSYFLFNSLTKISKDIRGIYAVFKSPTTGSSSDKILIKIYNPLNNDYVKVSLNGTTLKYRAKIGSASEITLLTDATISTSTLFTAGFNFDTLMTLTTADFKNFFGNINQLVVYLGGDYNGIDPTQSTTFTGNIYNFSFVDSKSINEISSSYNAYGTLNISESLLSKYSTYSFIPKIVVDNLYLDIRTGASWQDYVPIPVLSKYITDTLGNKNYGLTYVQLNVDYPELEKFSSGNYDTSSSIIKTYLTFQYLSDGASNTISSYGTTVSIPSTKKIKPSADLNWKTTKYEFVNNAIVYMPTVFDSGKTLQDLAIVLHIEFLIDGVINNPVKIKTLEIAPKALNSNLTGVYTNNNSINTKFGTTLYPVTVVSGNKMFDSENPIIISKHSSEYLNLTNTSGIKLGGDYNSSVDRSILFYLNSDSLSSFNINILQSAILWNETAFPTTPQKIFEILGSTDTSSVIFYIQSVSNNNTSRGKIFAKYISNSTEYDYLNVSYYWNGNKVNSPYLNIKEWGFLGISFNAPLKFNGSIGEFKLKSNLLVNNISYYQLSDSKIGQQTSYNTWSTTSVQNWTYWQSKTWNTVLLSSSNPNPVITPQNLYKIFTGTNKNIFDADNNTGKIRAHQHQYKFYKNTVSSSQILKPQ